MEIKGRRIHIAGSADPEQDEARLVYAHDLVSALTTALAESGASFVLPFGKEPRLRDRDDGPSIIFDWTVVEAAHSALLAGKASASGVNGRLAYTVATSKTDKQIPDARRGIYDALKSADAVHSEFLEPGWTAGAYRRDRQVELGDVLIALGGGEGVEHLARGYAARGKPIIPLDLGLGASQRDGSGGAARLFESALARPNDFFRVNSGQGADLLDRTRTRDGQRPVTQVVDAILRLLRALESPRVFYVRLLNDTLPEFPAVESYFRNTVDPFVKALGFEPKEMGRGPNEHVWMNQAIFDLMHHSSVVFVDLTALRPNCFMELGYALGNRQRTIISAMEGTNFPFDSYALEAYLWKQTDSDEDRIAKLRKHWERNINMPSLVKPREAR